MSRFTDLFQESTPAPVVESTPAPAVEPVVEPAVEAAPVSKKPLPKKKFTMD